MASAALNVTHRAWNDVALSPKVDRVRPVKSREHMKGWIGLSVVQREGADNSHVEIICMVKCDERKTKRRVSA